MRAACAVELIHAYSLVHDDMPCMDDDVMRRGKPTTHVAFGEAQAMLAGDAMQALAFEVLTPDEGIAPALQARLCSLLARSAGHDGMAGGQAIDLASIGKALDEQGVLNAGLLGALAGSGKLPIPDAAFEAAVAAGAPTVPTSSAVVAAASSGWAGRAAATALPPLSSTFTLNSRPGASRTIYLDFKGGSVTSTAWNASYNGSAPIAVPAYSTDADVTTYSAADLTEIALDWQQRNAQESDTVALSPPRYADEMAGWRIVVQREDGGLGGSRSLHEDVRVGSAVQVDGPFDDFRLAAPAAAPAARTILVAGGIGITPLLSMAYQLNSEGRPYQLIYLSRDAASTAFLQELSGPEFAGKVKIHHDQGDPERAFDLWPLLEKPGSTAGLHLYCCGPAGLMDAVRDMSGHWPASAVHFESFGADTAPPVVGPLCGESVTTRMVTTGSFDGRNPTNDA